MEPVILYKKKYHIDLSDVDFTKKLKLSTLFNYFQDIASEAASNLGVGIDVLEKEYGILWILMRIRVDIERLPEWDEEITIETWPMPPKRLEFDRDYLVKDRDGNIIIRAVSAWVIMDKEERKLKRSDSIPLQYPEVIEERAIDCRLGKVKSYGEPEVAYKKVIGYSDVDFNGHLNNSRYVDYMMDCFPLEEHEKSIVKSIEVNFTNEALPGETVVLLKDTTAIDRKQVYIEGLNEKNKKTVFKAKIEIDVK